MPRGNPDFPARFKKGQSGNPKGSSKIARARAAAKATLSPQDIEDIVALIFQGNTEELKRIASDPTSSVLRVWICSGAAKAIKNGDFTSLEIILNRVLGKPRETVRFTGSVATATSNMNQKRFLEYKKKFDEQF